jgi:outer membrane protein
MRMMTAAAALGALFALAAPAHAEAGKWQVKLLGTAVLPDGKIDQVKQDLVGVPAGTDTRANDNYVPTAAIEYFVTDNLSIETICCVTQHDVDVSTGPLIGAEMVSDAKIVPATVTLKYHFGDGSTVTPYIGAGPAYFLVLDDEPGAGAVGLGATGFNLDDGLGFALQAGLDLPVGNGLFLSLDAKRYFISADAHWFAGATEVLTTEHQLDPWVLSAGAGFTF